MRRSNAAMANAAMVILALIGLGGLAACGQSSEQAAGADAPAARGAVEANWQEFSFEDLGLAKSFPVEPTRSEGIYWDWPLT